MSQLQFNGTTHQLTLRDDEGKNIGTWAAYNNVDTHATLTHLPNRAYTVEDRIAPRHHTANANGPYGQHGIIRFNVPGHPDIGVHSGRANAGHLPGPAHPTMGCIRTTDEAMFSISNAMRTSALTSVEVINNNAPAARHATQKNHHANLHGRYAR